MLKKHDPRTQAFVANEVYTLITNPPEVPSVNDLRPLRHRRKLLLRDIADHFGVCTSKVSDIERATSRDDDFVKKYRQYLLEAA